MINLSDNRNLLQLLWNLPNNSNVSYTVNGVPAHKGWSDNKDPKTLWNQKKITEKKIETNQCNGLVIAINSSDNYIILDADSKEAVDIQNKLFNLPTTFQWYGTEGHLTSLLKLAKSDFLKYKKQWTHGKLVIKTYEGIDASEGPLEIKFMGSSVLPGSVHRKHKGIYKIVNGEFTKPGISYLKGKDAQLILDRHTDNQKVKSRASSKIIHKHTEGSIFHVYQEFLDNNSYPDIYEKFFTIASENQTHFTLVNPLFKSNSNTHKSLSVSEQTGKWRCFKSEQGGHLIELIWLSRGNTSSPTAKQRVDLIKEILKVFNVTYEEKTAYKGDKTLQLRNNKDDIKVIRYKSSKDALVGIKKFQDENPGPTNLIIKGPMGCGKTQIIGKQLAKGVTLLPTPIINLGIQQCKIFNATYHTDIDVDKRKKEIKQNVAITLDSLHKYKIHPDTVIFDEINSNLEHLLMSNTSIKDRRGETIEKCEELLRESNLNVYLDANINNLTCEWIKHIEDRPTMMIEIDPPIIKQELSLYKKKEDHLQSLLNSVSTIISNIKNDRRSGPIIFASDSQIKCEQMDMIISEQFKKEGLDATEYIFRIDSDTTSLPITQIAIEDINLFLKSNGIQVLIYSPSICSGISIEDIRYKTIYADVNGVFGIDKTEQLLGRLRPLENLHLVINRPIPKPLKTKEELIRNISSGFHCTIEDIQVRNKAIDDLKKRYLLWDKEDEELFEMNISGADLADNFYIGMHAELTVKNSYERNNYFELLIERLSKKFNITEIEKYTDKVELKKLLKEKREIINNESQKSVEQGMQMEQSQLDNLNDTRKNGLLKTGYLLKKNHPDVNFTSERILEKVVKDRGYIAKVKTGFIYQHKDIVEREDAKQIVHYINRLNTVGKKSTKQTELELVTNYKFYNETHQYLEHISLLSWISTMKKEWYTENSDCIQEIYSKITDELSLKHFNLNKDSKPVRYINKILQSFGFVILSKQARISNKKVRVYKIGILEDIENHPSKAEDIKFYDDMYNSFHNKYFNKPKKQWFDFTEDVQVIETEDIATPDEVSRYVDRKLDDLTNILEKGLITIQDYDSCIDQLDNIDIYNLYDLMLTEESI